MNLQIFENDAFGKIKTVQQGDEIEILKLNRSKIGAVIFILLNYTSHLP